MKGILFALCAALLFGASTPFAKLLIAEIEPVLLAGLLYLGSGVGLGIVCLFRLRRIHHKEASLKKSDWPWLGGAFFFGGVIGPVLLMIGLALTPASSASLLLNLEGVFTALLAWFVFREHFDARIVVGMGLIAAGGVCLSWIGRPEIGPPWGAIAIAGACLAWAIDNNLTRKVSAADPVQIAALKGLLAGGINTAIGLALGGKLPDLAGLSGAGLIGFLGYGVSLTCFVLALRHLGTARTGAYFSTAPFVGAAIAILLLGDRMSAGFVIAAILMGAGVWLHVSEYHEHEHRHEPMEHEHLHYHDEHHQHEHSPDDPPGEPHCHWHRHEELVHTHPHYPDIHHRHKHRH